MNTLNYHLIKSRLPGTKYMAKTIIKKNFDENDFINYLLMLDPSKSDYQIKEMIRLIIRGTQAILADGNSISIPDLIKITPSIRGAFENENETYNEENHKMNINFHVSRKFLNKFKNNTIAEKTKGKVSWPLITSVTDNKTKGNYLRKDSANRICGKYFTPGVYEFAGLSVTLKSDPAKIVLIGKNDLELISSGSTEMLFNFSKSFNPPEWLAENAGISLKLRYGLADGDFIESNAWNALWAL